MKAIVLNGCTFYFECASKFHSFILIKGLVHSNHGSTMLVSNIKLKGSGIEFQKFKVIPEEKDANFNYRFVIEANTSIDGYADTMGIEFKIDEIKILIGIPEVLAAIEYINSDIFEEFYQYVSGMQSGQLLDIGGRARSGVLRSDGFKNLETTVVDIVADEGVDIVVDAHNMTSRLEHNQFDACMCVSVFEHLIMPWKVVLEVNKVMKKGGIFFVATHQTVGLHDMPWDYYRFSDNAWDGLFNYHTGFEILNRSMSGLNFITPFAWSKEKNFSEKACGYESSTVLVRKIRDSDLQWPVVVADLINGNYPE
jgi:SAM-dependent methyltransferase